MNLQATFIKYKAFTGIMLALQVALNIIYFVYLLFKFLVSFTTKQY